jgi:hypothetical protein
MGNLPDERLNSQLPTAKQWLALLQCVIAYSSTLTATRYPSMEN